MNDKPTENSSSGSTNAEKSAPDARYLIRSTTKAALATLDKKTGIPFISMVAVACRMNAAPFLIISSIAKHTRNLEVNPNCSLLFEQAHPMSGSALEQPRLTVSGKMQQVEDNQAEQDRIRYMRRFPDAFYASFGDFSVYAMETEKAHLVGGFASTQNIPGRVLHNLPEFGRVEETDLNQINEKAQSLILKSFQNGFICDIDMEGFDISHEDLRTRMNFAESLTSQAQIETAIMSALTFV